MTTRAVFGGGADLAVCRLDLTAFPGGNIAVPSGLGVKTQVVYTSVGINTLGATVTGLDTITVPSAGVYLVLAKQPWLAGAGGSRAVEIDVNGSDVVDCLYPAPAAGAPAYTISNVIVMAAGDAVTCFGRQDSGAGQTMVAFANLAVVKLSN